LTTLPELEAAAAVVGATMAPTPQYAWPLLVRRAGCEVWVKHENHTPTGAFKVRGGLNLLAALAARPEPPRGIVSATRGNHGQSLAFAAAHYGVRTVIVVPEGNSADKNASMEAWGAELVVAGADFDAARGEAAALAAEHGLELVPAFGPEIVAGVAGYALELLRAVAGLDRVYVPIGSGSGICGLISARDALGLDTEIIGVVAEGADAYARSFAARRPVETERADTMADGMAVRVPVPAALDVILAGAARVVTVSDAAIEGAMRALFADTHNVAEGAGAGALAGLLSEDDRVGLRCAVVLCGGNVDGATFARVLAGG